MDIQNARYSIQNNLPVLKCDLDGAPAIIPPQQKPYLLDSGYVAVLLPPERSDMLQRVTIPASAKYGIGRPVEVGGVIEDAALVKLARQLIRDVERGSFAVGPVKVAD